MSDKPFTRAEAATALRLCEAATPEPWEWQEEIDGTTLHVAHGYFQAWSDGFPGFAQDKAFVSESRTALPTAIKMLERAAKIVRFQKDTGHRTFCICEECKEAQRWLSEWEGK